MCQKWETPNFLIVGCFEGKELGISHSLPMVSLPTLCLCLKVLFNHSINHLLTQPPLPFIHMFCAASSKNLRSEKHSSDLILGS